MQDLEREEWLHYRDRLRTARYCALADAEGFGEICFALEALGLRLLGKKSDMGHYTEAIRKLAEDSVVLTELSVEFPKYFAKFDALYETVRIARNDAMHTGVYARHATVAAIELCIGIEEALIKEEKVQRTQVADFMVKSPVSVEIWQPIAYARQMMLTHSFSYLPVFQGRWKLLSELAMAKYLNSDADWKCLMAATIEKASTDGLQLIDAMTVRTDDEIKKLLSSEGISCNPTLWIVEDEHGKIAGVLSPFELM